MIPCLQGSFFVRGIFNSVLELYFTCCVILGGERALDDDDQYIWLSTMNQALDKDISDENISWSAHFASMQGPVRPPALTALLPLFRDNAHSIAMIKHGMDLLRDATEHLNEGQIPVLTVDQPLYSITKKIQWA